MSVIVPLMFRVLCGLKKWTPPIRHAELVYNVSFTLDCCQECHLNAELVYNVSLNAVARVQTGLEHYQSQFGKSVMF